MRPVKWTELKDLCAQEGWEFSRHRGDHYIMTKAGATRPVVIPMRKGLKEDIVLGIARTMGMGTAELKARLAK